MEEVGRRDAGGVRGIKRKVENDIVVFHLQLFNKKEMDPKPVHFLHVYCLLI